MMTKYITLRPIHTTRITIPGWDMANCCGTLTGWKSRTEPPRDPREVPKAPPQRLKPCFGFAPSIALQKWRVWPAVTPEPSHIGF